MMTQEQVKKLLSSEETETIERKAGFDQEEIRKALIAFANDAAGRARAWLIIGQADNRDIVGLKMGSDEAQKKISDIARNQCKPAIPVSIEISSVEGKLVAIVEVAASPARPHFDGEAWVRIGSTTRRATDAEIILLRGMHENRKVALLNRFMTEGKTTVSLVNVKRHDRQRAELLEVTEDWITLGLGNERRALPLAEFNVGYDYGSDRPEIRYYEPA